MKIVKYKLSNISKFMSMDHIYTQTKLFALFFNPSICADNFCIIMVKYILFIFRIYALLKHSNYFVA